MLTTIFCPKCGKPWNPDTDDMVTFFNHSAVHTWIESDFHDQEWTVRVGVKDPQKWFLFWLQDEVDYIAKNMPTSEEEKLRLVASLGR